MHVELGFDKKLTYQYAKPEIMFASSLLDRIITAPFLFVCVCVFVLFYFYHVSKSS